MQFTFSRGTSIPQVEKVRVSQFPKELQEQALKQTIYEIVEGESAFDSQQLTKAFNAINSLDLVPYIPYICGNQKDPNVAFLLCSRLYTLLYLQGVCIDVNNLYNSLLS